MKALWALTGATILLYLLTLTPGLPPIDTGELIGCATTFGVPHPTGYPVYLLLARIFALLPISPITSLSILSVLAIAFATYFLGRSVVESSGSSGFGWLLALLFPLAPTVWNAGIRPEVYAFNILLLSGALWAGLRLLDGRERSELWFILFSAFAAVTHLSSGYFLLPLWVFALLESDTRKRILKPIPIGFAFLILTAHLILPLRLHYGMPQFFWGDMETVGGWWRHISGWQYRVWLFQSSEIWSNNMSNFFGDLPKNTFYVGIPLALTGLWFVFKQSPKRGLLMLILMLFPAIMVSGYSIPDLDSYYLPSLLIIAWLACYGGIELLRNHLSEWYVPVVGTILFVIIAIINLPQDTRTEDTHQLTYTRALLNQLPSSTVFFSGDWEVVVGPMVGLQAMGERRDVAVIDVELMRRSWYVDYLFNRYPQVIRGCESELRELKPALRRFEINRDEISPDTLEFLYRRAIRVLMVRNLGRVPVCMSYEVQPATADEYGHQLTVIAMPLFLKLQTNDVNYAAESANLKVDALYENQVDTRIDNRIREKAAVSMLYRAMTQFRMCEKQDISLEAQQTFRADALDYVRLARKLNPPDDSQFWKMLNLLQREKGQVQ